MIIYYLILLIYLEEKGDKKTRNIIINFIEGFNWTPHLPISIASSSSR